MLFFCYKSEEEPKILKTIDQITRKKTESTTDKSEDERETEGNNTSIFDIFNLSKFEQKKSKEEEQLDKQNEIRKKGNLIQIKDFRIKNDKLKNKMINAYTNIL